MAYTDILYEKKDGVAWITINLVAAAFVLYFASPVIEIALAK